MCSGRKAVRTFGDKGDRRVSCHRFVHVLPERLLRPPLGVGILLPPLGPEVPDVVVAGPLPGGSAGGLGSRCVRRRFSVQPMGPIR